VSPVKAKRCTFVPKRLVTPVMRLGSRDVGSYQFFLYLGCALGLVAANRAAHVAEINPARVFVAEILLLVPAITGAAAFYVTWHWREYWPHPIRTWQESGGRAMYGGVPVMLLLSVPVLRALDVSLGSFWDVATFTILVGMIITRVGCLMSGCCAGRPSQAWFAVFLPDIDGVWTRRIPNQLLEMALGTALIAAAVPAWHRLPRSGDLFLLAMAGYGLGRFVLQFGRSRSKGRRGWTPSHFVALGTVAVALGVFVVIGR
jgi:phosphatidylglycerol---prolipoprotein diacylglyceryl transferase